MPQNYFVWYDTKPGYLINAGSEFTLGKGQRMEEAHHSTVFMFARLTLKWRLLLLAEII